MRVHWIQHAPFEGLGAIADWMQRRGHRVSATRVYAGGQIPETVEAVDWLILMGGPMNIYQYRDYPWLRAEKELIRQALAKGRRVLGICLGAQLIADALGGKVFQNEEKEIGWFPVLARKGEPASGPFGFPAETMAFHWHGDTFSLPPGATWLAESAGCRHQAFAVGSRVLGLQFHLEMRPVDVAAMAEACGDDLTPGRYVQTPAAMAAGVDRHAADARLLLDRLLSALDGGQG